MSLYVSFFNTSSRKLNLEGSCAFKRMPPGRSKIWKRSLVWLLRTASSSYEPPALPTLSQPVATPGKVSAAGAAKCMCYIAFIFVLVKLLKLLNKLFPKNNNFRK
jgi:hypothetical protein